MPFDRMCSDWISADDLPCDLSTASEAQIDLAIEQATVWLFDATCQQYPGTCTSTLRPMPGVSTCAPAKRPYSPDAIDLSEWVTGPVTAIVQVEVSGSVVDADNYALMNDRWFVPQRPVGSDPALIPWPLQDYEYPDGGERSWTITVEHGEHPPAPLKMAATELACQLLRRSVGEECDLPDNATSVSRGGVTVSLQARAEGKIGLPLIDAQVERYGCAQTRTRRMYDPARPWVAVTPD